MVVWTRSSANWDTDWVFLQEIGDFYHIPCIKRVATPLNLNEKSIAFISQHQTIDIVIFTSSFAVSTTLQNEVLHQSVKRCHQIYAVGPATRKKVMQSLCLPCYLPKACRKSSDIFKTILKNCPPPKNILIPGAQTRADNLESNLIANGYKVDSPVVYRTLSIAQETNGKVLSKIQCDDLNAKLCPSVICFASPSAVKGFTTSFSKIPSYPAIQKPIAYCIGETTARECQKNTSFFSKVFTATKPSIKTLASEASQYQIPIF